MNGRFYVYLWLDPRTTPMTPRYVGKGADGRAWVFNRKKDKNVKLHYMITELRRTYQKPYVTILEFFDSEDACFAGEIAAIKAYGRADLGTGTLFNSSPGGRGNGNFKGHKIPQSKKRRAAAGRRMKKLNASTQHQNKAHHKKRTDPATRAVLAERMRLLNKRPEFNSEDRRAAAAIRIATLNKTRTYSAEERKMRSERATAMNLARAAAKHE